MIPSIETRTGAEMWKLGLGTWRMGENPAERRAEADALRLGLDLGMTLIDTAEMYAAGGAEEIVGGAVEGRRDEVFLVTKVLPSNASLRGTLRAAEGSLKRLRTDRIDLYLLHWESSFPLQETLEAFLRLKEKGMILDYGLSNFDTAEMKAAEALRGGGAIASDQVLYNLEHRGIERSLIPWCRRKGIAVMAYGPLGEGRLRVRPALKKAAAKHGVTPYQAALAWVLREEGVTTIPKAASPRHVRENAAAVELKLTDEDLRELDAAYPAPDREIPLDTA